MAPKRSADLNDFLAPDHDNNNEDADRAGPAAKRRKSGGVGNEGKRGRDVISTADKKGKGKGKGKVDGKAKEKGRGGKKGSGSGDGAGAGGREIGGGGKRDGKGGEFWEVSLFFFFGSFL